MARGKTYLGDDIGGRVGRMTDEVAVVFTMYMYVDPPASFTSRFSLSGASSHARPHP